MDGGSLFGNAYISYAYMLEGVVVSNYDKEKKGTLKVKFPLMEEKKDSITEVGILMPYGGEKNGMYFVPEVGDCVLVLFTGERYTKGYVIGSVYKKNNTLVGQSCDEKNNQKQISTRSGIKIELSDEDKKEKISLMTPKEQQVVIDDGDEKIILRDKQNNNKLEIDIKDGKIEIQAAKEISMQVGESRLELKEDGGIQIKGKDVALKGQNVNLSAASKMHVAGQEVNVQGQMAAKLCGKTKLECTSSGQIKVKGTMIKLN